MGAFGQWPSIVYTVFINRILAICKYPAGNPSAALASSQETSLMYAHLQEASLLKLRW